MAMGPQSKNFAQNPKGTAMRNRLIQLPVTSLDSATASVLGDNMPALTGLCHRQFTTSRLGAHSMDRSTA